MVETPMPVREQIILLNGRDHSTPNSQPQLPKKQLRMPQMLLLPRRMPNQLLLKQTGMVETQMQMAQLQTTIWKQLRMMLQPLSKQLRVHLIPLMLIGKLNLIRSLLSKPPMTKRRVCQMKPENNGSLTTLLKPCGVNLNHQTVPVMQLKVLKRSSERPTRH